MNTSTTEGIALVIDSSGSSVFVGLLNDQDKWLAKVNSEGAPLEELFTTVDAALSEARIELRNVSQYIYCEGPGSVLGLRLCAMAMETWSRLYPNSAQFYKYNSLQLTALALQHSSSNLEEALIVADWKKGAWNALYIKDGAVGSTEVIDDTTLANWTGSLYHLPQRKGWQSPPANTQTIAYDPTKLSQVRNHPTLLKKTDGIELYNSGINTFQKWTPERHRA